jgi:hypothetical protein
MGAKLMGQCDEFLRTYWGTHWELGEHVGNTLRIKQFKNPHYKRICGFCSHKKLWLGANVWDKLCGFIHYNVQYVMFIMAYLSSKVIYLFIYLVCHDEIYQIK